MTLLKRDDTDLYYETTGTGSPVLLTHGFAATSSMWRAQVDALEEQHELIRWDLRGHGQTITPAESALYSVEDTVADMAALLDELGHERAVLGGHSLGGYLSLAFALHHPERVRALVLIGTGPGYKKDAPRDEWNKMVSGLGERLDKRGLGVLEKMSAEMDPREHGSATSLGLAAKGILVQRDRKIIDSLPDVRVPTLVIVGAKDRGFIGASDYMTQKIPDAELITIPNAGHAVNAHQPQLFNAALAKFLSRIQS